MKRQNRQKFLSLDYLLDIHEIVFAVQNAMHNKSVYHMTKMGIVHSTIVTGIEEESSNDAICD